MARVLVIGDIHEPATHPGYLPFCLSIAERWKTDRVVMIGDVLDFHAISHHAKHPDTPGSSDEAGEAREAIAAWHRAFPRATVTIGNHDERVHRLASTVQIPGRFIQSFNALWGTKGWKWTRSTTIDRVHYLHGTGLGGQQPALAAARASMVPTVCGHVHSVGGVRWASGPSQSIWGMDTGCGVDATHPAMSYGRDLIRKPVLGAGVVLDGMPYYERMPADRGQPFHISRFGGRK